MNYRTLRRFDPNATFTATRNMRINGKDVVPGDQVTGVAKSRLRQLYETRRITPVNAARVQPEAQPQAKTKPVVPKRTN